MTTTTDAAREIELSTKQQTTAVEQVNIAIVNVVAGLAGDRGERGPDPADGVGARGSCRPVCRAVIQARKLYAA